MFELLTFWLTYWNTVLTASAPVKHWSYDLRRTRRFLTSTALLRWDTIPFQTAVAWNCSPTKPRQSLYDFHEDYLCDTLHCGWPDALLLNCKVGWAEAGFLKKSSRDWNALGIYLYLYPHLRFFVTLLTPVSLSIFFIILVMYSMDAQPARSVLYLALAAS